MKQENPSKIRVCFVSPKAYPLFNPAVASVFGGAEVDLYLLATELAKDERFDVRFVVGDYGQPTHEVRAGVTLFRSINAANNRILQAWKVWQALKRADARIYMHETWSLGMALVSLFCTINQRTFFYRTAHTDETDGTCLRRNLMNRWFMKWAFRLADTLIVQNTDDVAALKKSMGLSAMVIRNACRIPASVCRDKSFILWVGRSAAFKKPRRFLELAQHFPQEEFIMICQQAFADTNYNALKQDAGKVRNLKFIERVSFQDVDSYFERAKVFVNTSDSEGFPNTFLQACKAGTAILSYAVNPDAFLDKYRCGFCCQGNQNLLTQQLQTMLDHDTYRELGLNGRTYVKKNHDLTAIVEDYKVLFRSEGKQP